MLLNTYFYFKMQNEKTLFLIISMTLLLFSSCKKEKEEKAANEKLFQEATANGYTYYQNGAVLDGLSPSPHGQFKLRFNSIAQNALASVGELMSTSTFPEGAIIVKELYSNNQLMLLAIMKKAPSDEYAGDGWVWAEIKPNGDSSFGVERKGNGCIGCHSGNPQSRSDKDV
jgi:hypothetical protein